ncbi:MAG: ROK family glucokinase [Candidatus Omnitrophota bacterium]
MKKYTVAIDLGGTTINMAVVKSPDTIAKKIVLSTKAFSSKDGIINAISDTVKKLMRELHLKKSDILGIGIGTPGLVDSQKGVIHYLVNIRGWKNVPLKRILEKKTGLPTFLDNDVNLMTLGELYYGAGKGAQNIICLTLGTGVGGGIVVDGKIYRGSTLSAGEIGHVPLNEKGPKCNCGGSGCIERYVGNEAITRLAVNEVKRNRKSRILKIAGGKLGDITPETVTRAARTGDPLAKEIWRRIAAHLGIGLSGIVNTLNPETIIIGGGVAEAGKFLFDPLRDVIHSRAMRVPARAAKVLKARLGRQAGLIGASVLVRIEKGEL